MRVTGVAPGDVLVSALFDWIIAQGWPGWIFGLPGTFTAIGLVTVLVPERIREPSEKINWCREEL